MSLKNPAYQTLTEFVSIKFDEIPRSPLWEDTEDPMGLFIDENGDAIAIIPDKGDGDFSTCYQYVGQHSEISADYSIEKLKEVDPYCAIDMEKAADLCLHLMGQGYKPVVIRTRAFNNRKDWDCFISAGLKFLGYDGL